MDDRRALTAAIIDNPDEDTPRLALADWLQEHGDAHDRARAEFIRLQIRAAQAKPGKARDKLSGAAEKLERKHRAAWVKPLAAIDPKLEPEDYVEFRRGLLGYTFLDTGKFLLKAFQSVLPDALAAVGVEELCFYSPTKRIEEFANAPALRWAARVQYPGADDAFLAALATAPHCAHLSGIELQEVSVTDAGLKAFAKSTGTTRLRTLTVSTTGALSNKKPKFTAAGVRALLNSDRLPHLDSLELDTGPAKFDVAPLLAAPGLQKLQTLWLSCPARLADVVASPHLANLTTLILHEAETTDADADALVGPKFAKLETVILYLPARPARATEKKLKKRFGKGLTLEYEEEE